MPLLAAEHPLSLGEQIANQIAEDILQELLKPGDAIPERQLAETYHVSHGPIREALCRYCRDGGHGSPNYGGQNRRDFCHSGQSVRFGGTAICRAGPQARFADLGRAVQTNESSGAGAGDDPRRGVYTNGVCVIGPMRQQPPTGNDLTAGPAGGSLCPARIANRRRASITSWRAMLRAFRQVDAPDAEHITRQMISNTHQEVISSSISPYLTITADKTG